ncbi:hypothetical protein ColLi_13410 [Colletotrichum liriopes]|uniref:Uncharacterized protein n=1 Tax=Colletotrichum liriopes TaxID=708192 RepID=A0AA37H290_9PEZI|nr:hypothetical protein ColLi_13410 [Colletotrichum liriopes]
MELLKTEFSKEICEAYLGQLHLRKQLNLIHSMLYDPDPSKERFREALNIAESLRSMQWTTPTLRFSENDMPADNLFEARLRAKYWGAQVLVCRPSIKRLLDASENPRWPSNVATNKPKTISSRLQGVGGDNRRSNDIIHAKRGIEALFNSTEAFHGLDTNQRLLVTNIFGTAHA